jgi:hypothetical protein
MLFTIPLESDAPAYTLDVDMGGRPYRLALTWNTRGAFWTLGVFLTDDTPIVTATKLVADWDLFSQFNDDRLPPGRLLLVDLETSGLPVRYDLGTRCILVYDDGE